jgi:hypothetical protein
MILQINAVDSKKWPACLPVNGNHFISRAEKTFMEILQQMNASQSSDWKI